MPDGCQCNRVWEEGIFINHIKNKYGGNKKADIRISCANNK